jgi:hypothetical protein
MAYYVVFGPAATSLETLARIGAGRSRSASRRPSRRSGWTATRCAAGTAGTATSLCRCWRWPFWRRCGSPSPAKRGRGIWRIHCLQHARDPPPHHPLPAERRLLHRLHSRLVALAPDPSGRQTPDLPANSTVVLVATTHVRSDQGRPDPAKQSSKYLMPLAAWRPSLRQLPSFLPHRRS